MIIIEFYKSNRKNARSLKRYSFQYDNYTELNYIYTVLSYVIEFKPNYYTINYFNIVGGFKVSTSSYRNYKKLDMIEIFINDLVGHALLDGNAEELKTIYKRTITRQLINKFYLV